MEADFYILLFILVIAFYGFIYETIKYYHVRQAYYRKANSINELVEHPTKKRIMLTKNTNYINAKQYISTSKAADYLVIVIGCILSLILF